MNAARTTVRLLAVAIAGATSAVAAIAHVHHVPPAPADLIGRHIAPAAQSDDVFNRFGVRTTYQLIHRKPLLIVSWRADDASSLEHAVPAALELQQTYGEDLALLFVERSGRPYANMLKLVCQQGWLCGDAMWTGEQPEGLDAMPSPSFVLTSMWHVAVLTGDLIADRDDLATAIGVVVGQRLHGEDDLPPEARAAWEAVADGQWLDALQIGRAAEKRFARDRTGDEAAGKILEEQARLLDDALMNEIQIAVEMSRSGSAGEAKRRVETFWKRQGLKKLPPDARLRRAAQGLLDNIQHGSMNPEIDACEALETLQDRLCRSGPGKQLAAAFRKLAKDHPDTKAAERALSYAAMCAEP